MEIRRTLIANYKSDFLINDFEKIEDLLTREFLNYFWKLLPLKNNYTDWLSQKIRPIVNNIRVSVQLYISTDYIKSDGSKLSQVSLKNFIMFIKFTKELKYEIQKFDNQYDSKIQIANVIPRKKDLIVYKILFGELSLPTYIYLMDDKFLRHPEISSIIRELRGGAWWTALIGNTIFVAVLYGIWLLASGSEGFVQQPNPGWGLGNNNPGLVRPADCETQLYSWSLQQSLKTAAFRNQPNPKDRWILVESRPELIIRRGQAQFKTKDHGALAGLSYKIKKNEGTSTAKTEGNIDKFINIVEEIIENPNSIGFEDGTYQGETNREVESLIYIMKKIIEL